MLDLVHPTFIPHKWGNMPRRISEDATCKQTIDPQLEKVGWFLRGKALRELQSQTQEELPLSLRFGGASRDALLPSVLDKLSTLTLYEGFQQGASQR